MTELQVKTSKSTKIQFGSFLPYKIVILKVLKILIDLLCDQKMVFYQQIWYHLEAKNINFNIHC